MLESLGRLGWLKAGGREGLHLLKWYLRPYFCLQVQAYLYDGYWEDIGTIEAFYNANLGITKKPIPDFRYAHFHFSLCCSRKLQRCMRVKSYNFN
jgi:hypothetical protein